MIIRETAQEYVMIPQHEHAQLSGVFADHVARERLEKDSYHEDFLLAVYQHDRSWIRLDDTPIWNDGVGVPFSFLDYPLLLRLTLYSYGLNEIEKKSKYACLLCSLHYSSFFRNSTNQDCIVFYRTELLRQDRIIEELRLLDKETINQHFRLLQFCDDLSLYVCLNEPGISKQDEHPWYRNGIDNSEFLTEDLRQINAQWNNGREIRVHPFPFDSDFTATLRQKHVPKDHILKHGLGKAYKQAEYIDQQILVCK